MNENGKLLHLAEIPIEPEANGTWKTTVDAPHGRLGFYRVYARLSNRVQLAKLGSRGAGYLTYCIVPDSAARRVFSAAETFFGMQGGFNPKVNIVPYLGIRWLLGPYSWKDMEPNRPGEFVEQRVAAKREGRQFPPDPDSAEWTVGGQRWRTYNIPTMLSPPRWAVVPGTMSAGTGTLNPAGEQEWKDYCLAVGKANAEDHPDRAERLYQITWEPDIGFTGTDEDLLRMYQIAYPALHEADPKARVLGPTAHLNVQWQCNLSRNGLGRYLDGWTIHPSGFEGAALIEMVRALKVSIRQYIGRDLPVYGTEQNSSTNENPGKELDQACGLLRGNLIMLGEDFRLNIAFYIADGSGEPGYGYFYNLNPKMESGTDKIGPKPIAPAYAAQSFLLEGYRSAGPIDGLGESVGGYAYQRGDDVVLALWDYGGRPRHVSLPTGASQVDVYDWMGNKNTALTPNLTLSLTLGPEPVYVTGISAQFWNSRRKKYSKQKTSPLVRAPGTNGRAVHQTIPWTRYDAESQANLAAATASMPAGTGAATPPVSAIAAQAPPRTQEPPADDDRWTAWQDLFDGRSLDGWTPSGSARVENGSLILENGRFAGLATTRSVPKIGYEVAVEAMRLTGKDFASLVFPVHEMRCGLTVGGFSGDVVGFGNVNGLSPGGPQCPLDRRIVLEANRWYTVRLRVTAERITVWLDNRFVMALNPRGCTFEALGPPLRPLGVFAAGGKAAFRSVRLRQRKSPPARGPENAAGPAIENWVKTVAALPPEEQLKAVSQKLTELNPGFDGRMTGYDGKGEPTILAGAVTQLGFMAGDVIDISPLQALVGLKAFSCFGGPSGSTLTDLSPLAGMQLTMLKCGGLLLSDLSPPRGMPLTYMECGYTRLSDLSPLKGMRLTYLGLSRTRGVRPFTSGRDAADKTELQ